jgi:hypothetical protein
MPPGNRTRARAPSAASCTCSALGQASRSRVLATKSPYGALTNRARRVALLLLNTLGYQ